MSDFAIKAEHVSKSFKLPHEKYTGLKQAVINFRPGKKYDMQHVLTDVSFEIKKGEFFGIVGRNGSGKSTLLKLLAQTYTPNSGTVAVKGSLTPFIELGVGFNPELTGRENVYLNGSLLGFDRKQMNGMYDEIVEFAELGEFMDQKLKNYSSGMQVRLAFSIAIRAKTDILLIDEVLAVGDAAFQRKCYDYFMRLKTTDTTVILVTHDMSAVRQYCDRAIMIDKGSIVKEGSPEEIAQDYQQLFIGEASAGADNQITGDQNRWGNGKVRAKRVATKVTSELVHIEATFEANSNVPASVYGFSIYSPGGVHLIDGNTLKSKITTPPLKAKETLTLKWAIPNIFASGEHSVSVACCDMSTIDYYDWLNNAGKFGVNKPNPTAGVIDPDVDTQEVAKN